jgi:hypothetical protein
MKRLVAALLVLTLSTPVLAQDIKAIPPGDDKIVPLELNQPAPFDGQLFSAETSLRWANWLKQYQLVLKLNHEYGTKICKVNVDYLQSNLDLLKSQYKVVTEDYQDRVSAAQNETNQLRSKRSDNIWLGFGLGVLVTSVMIGIGVYAAK